MKKPDIKKLVNSANLKLLEQVNDGNMTAIKFILENLDADFNVNVKDIINSLFNNIMSEIDKTELLNNEQKIVIINLLKKTFNG